jgi:peptidoglycan/LPS O-acetylase OafA/YrhL
MGNLDLQPKPRLAYIDNIKWVMIFMVVLDHATVTYSGLGSWFYNQKSVIDPIAKLLFSFYGSFAEAFFMGILFFVAATFVPASYDRKGFGRFVADRCARLGVPVLTFMFVLDPLIRFLVDLSAGRASWSRFASGYVSVIASGAVLARTGPLWFALALLVFSILYALARLVVSQVPRRPASAGLVSRICMPAPRTIHVAALALMAIIATGSFFIRLAYPIGTAWFNLQLCYFAKYVVLFPAGLWAARAGFLRSVPARIGKIWLRLAFVVGVPVWFLLLGLGGGLHSVSSYFGGWHWQAAGYAAWEAFFVVSVSLGLLVLFREKAEDPSPVTTFLARTSFGVYTFHPPILVAVSLVLQAVALYVVAKAVVAAALALAISLVVAALVRKLPRVGRIFS